MDPARVAPLARRVAEAGGAVKFETWMDLALHDAELGYYARNIRTVGPRGDFATASTLHPALGEAVAAWAAARRPALGGAFARWDLVEAGPGSGALAEAVLASLPLLARRTVRLHLVETSPVLAAAQRGRLGTRATWHATLEGALKACGGKAVVYASELLDAFPVQVLRWSGTGWQALWISSKGDEWVEEWRPASSELLGGAAAASAFSALSRPWPEGQRVEIAPSVRSLFLSKESFSSLLSGSLLLLDYGDTIDRLYDRRPNGTVRGYAHHRRLEGEELYRWGGKADVTADVNFTDVAAWAAEAGFAVSPLETQGAFLARHVRDAAARAAREPALAFLLDPRGAGSGFRALELSRL
ncbi:MAG: SAM-dependent methyltransferase [Acidobacteriota bacterium]